MDKKTTLPNLHSYRKPGEHPLGSWALMAAADTLWNIPRATTAHPPMTNGRYLRGSVALLVRAVGKLAADQACCSIPMADQFAPRSSQIASFSN